MSIISYCETEKKIYFELWDGEVDDGQWLDHIRRVIDDPAWRACHIRIIDLTAVSGSSSIDGSTMNQAVALLSKYSVELGKNKIAIVARATFDKARKFDYLMGKIGVNIIVFAALNIACTYLGLDWPDVDGVFNRLREQAQGNPVEPS